MTVSPIKAANPNALAFRGVSLASTRNQIARQSTGVLLGQALGFACGFSSNLLVAWLLGPQGKGLIYLIQFVASTAVILLNFGLGPSVAFHLGRGAFPEREIVGALLWPSLLSGLLPAAGLGLLWPWLGHLAAVKFGVAYLWLTLAAIPGMVLTWNVSFFNLAKGQILAYNFLRVVPPVVFLLGVICVAFWARPSVLWVAMAWLISVSIPAMYAASITNQKHGTEPRFAFLFPAFHFGLRSHLGAVTQYLQHRVDIVLVSILLPLGDVGLYSVAVVVAELLWYLPNTLAAVLMPHIAASSHEDANRLTAAFCRGLVALNAMLALVLALLCTFIIPRLLPAFQPSIRVVWLLLPGIVAASAFKVLSSDFNGRGKPLDTFRPAIVSLAACVLAGLLVIPRFGIDGAAAVTSAGYFLNAYLFLRGFSHNNSVSYGDLLLIRFNDLSSIHGILRSWILETGEGVR